MRLKHLCLNLLIWIDVWVPVQQDCESVPMQLATSSLFLRQAHGQTIDGGLLLNETNDTNASLGNDTVDSSACRLWLLA